MFFLALKTTAPTHTPSHPHPHTHMTESPGIHHVRELNNRNLSALDGFVYSGEKAQEGLCFRGVLNLT